MKPTDEGWLSEWERKKVKKRERESGLQSDRESESRD
jgi:hypothetical protein